jgi:hypothetical protein
MVALYARDPGFKRPIRRRPVQITVLFGIAAPLGITRMPSRM